MTTAIVVAITLRQLEQEQEQGSAQERVQRNRLATQSPERQTTTLPWLLLTTSRRQLTLVKTPLWRYHRHRRVD